MDIPDKELLLESESEDCELQYFKDCEGCGKEHSKNPQTSIKSNSSFYQDKQNKEDKNNKSTKSSKKNNRTKKTIVETDDTIKYVNLKKDSLNALEG